MDFALPMNAFTVDVEDYFHVSGFADRIDRGDWDRFESRVVANTHRMLELFAEHHVRATFFVLGWVAEREPSLIDAIVEGGHEVGCHSDTHQLVYDLGPQRFREDLRSSRDRLEQLAGRAVTSYRAPSFSVTERSLWALEILVEEGFRDDSSIFPTHHDRYGIPDSPVAPYVVETPSGPLREFPGTVRRVFGMGLPVSGGGYFRLLPRWFSSGALRKVNDAERRPFVFYVHPWEIDPDQPRLEGGRLARWRHYVNLSRTWPRLEWLLERFRFGPMRDVLDGLDGRLPRLTLDELTGRPTTDVEPTDPVETNG